MRGRAPQSKILKFWLKFGSFSLKYLEISDLKSHKLNTEITSTFACIQSCMLQSYPKSYMMYECTHIKITHNLHECNRRLLWT